MKETKMMMEQIARVAGKRGDGGILLTNATCQKTSIGSMHVFHHF